MKRSFALATILAVASAAAWAEPAHDPSLDLIGKYLSATEAQKEKLRGLQMEAQIEAKLPKLQKQGKLIALRVISQIGKISYVVRSFVGDGTIKKEVIARYLEAEQQAAEGPGTMGITPDNYKFKYKGSMSRDGRMVHILALTPREKRVGLFKGEIWLDTETYLPIRETGLFVKTPSVFLKKVEFTRDYQIRDGVAFPSHIESHVDARLVGKADLSIRFTNISLSNSDVPVPTEETPE